MRRSYVWRDSWNSWPWARPVEQQREAPGKATAEPGPMRFGVHATSCFPAVGVLSWPDCVELVRPAAAGRRRILNRKDVQGRLPRLPAGWLDAGEAKDDAAGNR
ncbi:hypothetical protein HPB50_009766 [Hyalomma asiaticum]|uniref:Uncharacterized protein n=1 Tax=Hyalomma asiaticum TaxID=266040 RepID=A0ACB7S3U7_HYAAI|nr:hypothetical protein HPB50_009766 [Hyalomma asiaticum]